MTKSIDFKAAALSGVIAGAVFLAAEMALVALLMGESPWAPPRMMAAIVQGPGVLPPPATFDAGIVAVAMLVHFGLSVALGVAFAVLHGLLKASTTIAIVAGVVFGLAVYVVDFYVLTAVFPWFAMARNMISIFAHALFGLVLGWSYHRLARTAVAADPVAAR